MSNTSAQNTRNKLAKMYIAGTVVFTAIFGTLTLVVVFLSHVSTN